MHERLRVRYRFVGWGALPADDLEVRLTPPQWTAAAAGSAASAQMQPSSSSSSSAAASAAYATPSASAAPTGLMECGLLLDGAFPTQRRCFFSAHVWQYSNIQIDTLRTDYAHLHPYDARAARARRWRSSLALRPPCAPPSQWCHCQRRVEPLWPSCCGLSQTTQPRSSTF